MLPRSQGTGLRLAEGHLSFGPAKSGGFGYDGADFWVADKGLPLDERVYAGKGRRFRRRYFN
jgi:hypothetical protein